MATELEKEFEEQKNEERQEQIRALQRYHLEHGVWPTEFVQDLLGDPTRGFYGGPGEKPPQ